MWMQFQKYIKKHFNTGRYILIKPIQMGKARFPGGISCTAVPGWFYNIMAWNVPIVVSRSVKGLFILSGLETMEPWHVTWLGYGKFITLHSWVDCGRGFLALGRDSSRIRGAGISIIGGGRYSYIRVLPN
jgi:hypothetical protein